MKQFVVLVRMGNSRGDQAMMVQQDTPMYAEGPE